MEHRHSFTSEEQFCIGQLVKKGYQTRTIARTLDRDVIAVHQFIRAKNLKRSEVRSEAQLQQRITKPEGVPHYTDPDAPYIGSRLLLEAVAKYFAKREGVQL